jgi:hypothetical protein
MKSRTIIILSLLICSISLSGAFGRIIPRQRREIRLPSGRTIKPNNTVDLDLSYDFSVSGQTRRLSLTALIPKTIPNRQKIIDIQYSIKPLRVFDQNGNRYAEFVFYKPEKEINIDISIKAELIKYDLVTAKRKRKTNHTLEAEHAEFLKSEKYVEKDHQEIQQIAQNIEGQTEEEIVKKIYNYVIEHLDYSKHGKGQWGAVKALKEGKGDCSEYSDLFVALCRAKNIPARVITGCTVRFDSDSPKHNWAEVYMQDYGWVPFDPSGGDIENERIRNIVFGRMAPVFIYFSHIRNDEVLRNFHFTSYKYWGDRVRLKDSIEFKQPAQTNSK